MKIYLGTDHAGFALKGYIKDILQSRGHTVDDLGAHEYHQDDDYPDLIRPIAQAVAMDIAAGIESKGVILGGSGQGEAIVVNRILGIRAVVYYGGAEDIVRLARAHNDANVLSLGARFLTEHEAQTAVEIFLSTEYSHDDRHIRRIKKIDRT